MVEELHRGYTVRRLKSKMNGFSCEKGDLQVIDNHMLVIIALMPQPQVGWKLLSTNGLFHMKN